MTGRVFVRQIGAAVRVLQQPVQTMARETVNNQKVFSNYRLNTGESWRFRTSSKSMNTLLMFTWVENNGLFTQTIRQYSRKVIKTLFLGIK